MKTFRMESRANYLMFQNIERVDEEQIFVSAQDCLSSMPNVVVGERIEAPYADIINGTVGKIPFSLLLDLNYGTEIFCEDSGTLALLESELNK